MRRLGSIILVLAGLLLLAITPLQAQSIRVRSGDHPGFTRLVLPIGAEREWDLTQQTDGQWLLSLTPVVDGFDISTAFDLIQRTRLSNLIAAQTLALDLACACDVSSFRYDTRFLVIDIADPDPNAPPPDPAPPDPAIQERADAAEALPDLANLLRRPGALPQIEQPSSDTPSPANPSAPEIDPPNPRLAEAAQIMAEQLARAAASGLLDVALDEPLTAADPTEGASLDVDDAAEEERPALEHDLADGATQDPHPDEAEPSRTLPIRAQTAFDPEVQLELPIGPPQEAASCDGVPFTVADWSEGGGIYQNLGALRRDLYDERDVLTVDGATRLAEHYLFYGFGAEAAYWLAQIDNPPDALLNIAALVDGAENAPFLPVEAAEDCSQGELLWRYLSGSVPNRLEGSDTAAIQRAFGELPAGLRDQMGPRLAVRLVDEGYAGTARNIRDVLHRGGRIDVASLRLLDLELGIALESSPDQTQQELAEALRDDGGEPATVLAHALAFDRRVGTPPPPIRLVTADALIREIGNGPETDDLWRETLLGHAALGQIDEALNRLGDPARSEIARAEALTDLIAERVAVDDTAALVILAYTYGRDWRPEGSEAGRVQVRAIATLRANGLFEAAQILRDVRRPLILPAPDAVPEDVVDDATVAWLEGDWARLAETGSGTHADIATRLAQLDESARSETVGPPNLDAMNETLVDSRALRAVVADLLAAPALP